MNGSTLSIAVVDDDASFSRAVSRLLSATGFEPSVHRSAEAFLEGDMAASADCLVLDIELGGISGLDLRRRLTALGVTAPVIFVTAHDESEIREEARQIGCSAFFSKPVSSELLVEAIRRAVKLANR